MNEVTPAGREYGSGASVFCVGERVRLIRELPSLPIDSEGHVRGLSANAAGIRYVVRFLPLTRVVAERDLVATPS